MPTWSRIALGDSIYSIGRDERSEADFLSGPFQGLVFDDGLAVVADMKSRRVIAARPGRAAEFLVDAGEGPGEVVHPSALFADIGGAMGILDNSLRRLTRYDLSGAAAKLVDVRKTSVQPVGACAVGSRYAILEYSRDRTGVFGVFGLDGTAFAVFGSPFVGEGSRIQIFMETQGRLVCLDDPPRFVVATTTGELRAYLLDGSVIWRRLIPDFVPGGAIAQGTEYQRLTIAPDRAMSRLLASFVLLDDSTGLVQLREFHRSSGSDGVSEEASPGVLETLIVGTSDGDLRGRQIDLPLILAASDSLLLVEYSGDVPWLGVVKFEFVARAQAGGPDVSPVDSRGLPPQRLPVVDHVSRKSPSP